MAYVKVGPWANLGVPALSAANLNTVETQYDEAIDEVFDSGGIGALPMSRMPRDTDGLFLRGKGAGVNPEYAAALENTIEYKVDWGELRNSNDTERYTALGQATYAKVKECLLNADLPACGISFDVKMYQECGAYWEGYARIYKNGVAIGTEWMTTSEAYATKSQSFSGFESGDLIQIYAYVSSEPAGCYRVYVRNMRFYYTEYITALGGWELVVGDHIELVTPSISITNQDP